MKIGVLDTDGYFKDSFFSDKDITVLRSDYKTLEENEIEGTGFTHGELVCSYILKENPMVEIILIPIIHNGKCSVLSMLNGIQKLMDENVNMINLSIGDEYKYHKEVEELCLKAWKKGILIVAAHSNNSVMATYPASFSFVLGVKCVNEEKTIKIMKYHEKENDVIFSSKSFSIYHLGIPKLIHGNSFGCAKITGLLSHRKQYDKFLIEFENNRLNTYYPFQILKEKRCIFLTNRITESLEQMFIKEATDSIEVMSFEEGLEKLEKDKIKKDEYEILFIDHDSFKDIFPYKIRIIDLLFRLSKEMVIRYPLFSLSERLEFYEKEHIVISQFSI